MRASSFLRPLSLFAAFTFVACGSASSFDTSTPGDGGDDTSSGGDTAGGDTTSSDTKNSDTTPVNDTNGVDTKGLDTAPGGDTATTDTSVGGDGDVGPSCKGVECAGFPSSFVKGCGVDDNCVGEMHQVDCCGEMKVIGVNHSEAGKFCAAEIGSSTGGPGCRASYTKPAPCSSNVITAEDGATTTDPTKVAVRCDGGTCKTFVCGLTGGTPCPPFRRIGTCGP